MLSIGVQNVLLEQNIPETIQNWKKTRLEFGGNWLHEGVYDIYADA